MLFDLVVGFVAAWLWFWGSICAFGRFRLRATCLSCGFCLGGLRLQVYSLVWFSLV